MSQQVNGGRDPKSMKRIYIKQDGRIVGLVIPPMDKQAEWDMKRCAQFVLDMMIKYGPAILAEKEKSDSSGIST